MKNEIDVDDDELEKLNTLAVSSMGRSHVRESMALHYPTRDFDPKMLDRLMEAELDRKFGATREQMDELFVKGRKAEQDGGVWLPILGELGLRIAGCHYQNPTERLYAQQFGSYYFTADGSHGMNKYGLTTVPFICPDSLALSHCCGIGIYPSKNGDDIDKLILLIC